MIRAAAFLLCVALAAVSPAAPGADAAGDVLMAIEAARHAQTDRQREQAALSLEVLAHENAPGAASALAALIVDGHVEASLASARRWAERGHALGEPDATHLLARMWANGQGGDTDLGRAATLAREASLAGLPAASVLIYELLVDTDQADAALTHLALAAEAGYPRAQHLLGMHLAAGEGLERDYEEAFFWLVLAAAHGATEARSMVDAVGANLTFDVRQSLIQAAIEWQPQ